MDGDDRRRSADQLDPDRASLRPPSADGPAQRQPSAQPAFDMGVKVDLTNIATVLELLDDED